jgi:hypothetical protein
VVVKKRPALALRYPHLPDSLISLQTEGERQYGWRKSKKVVSFGGVVDALEGKVRASHCYNLA